MNKIVLASRSNDRSELLKRIKIPHEILITDIDESKYKKEISDPIDYAIIAVPARVVPKVLEEVGQKSIPFCTIFSSGFREVGNQEQRVADIRSGIELLRKLTR